MRRGIRRTQRRHHGRWARDRARRDEGVTLLEFALVAPIFLFLACGIFEFSMGFSDLSALRTGVREGARFGAVAEFGTVESCDISGSATGATARLVCQTKGRTELPSAEVRVKIDFATTNTPGESIVVCAQYPMQSVTGVFSPFTSGRVLTSRVSMRIEEIDATLTEFEETPVSGSSWSWC